MKKEWTSEWEENVNTGKEVNLPGNTSTSRSIKVALNFAKVPQQDSNTTTNSVIFVFLFTNYCGFPGFRLSDSRYSAYPNEEEYLLVEGCPVRVLQIADMVITNSHPAVARYNGKTITVFYLYA